MSLGLILLAVYEDGGSSEDERDFRVSNRDGTCAHRARRCLRDPVRKRLILDTRLDFLQVGHTSSCGQLAHLLIGQFIGRRWNWLTTEQQIVIGEEAIRGDLRNTGRTVAGTSGIAGAGRLRVTERQDVILDRRSPALRPRPEKFTIQRLELSTGWTRVVNEDVDGRNTVSVFFRRNRELIRKKGRGPFCDETLPNFDAIALHVCGARTWRT